jgi:hypothetical protein
MLSLTLCLCARQLAIVHMSDQFTRVTTGGSPLEATAPVVGLLFGTFQDNKLQVNEADDIPTDISEVSTLQVELHRAVFPQHSVVGWYRVSLQDDEPTPSDLAITQQLQAHYSSSNEQQQEPHFVFCLLQVSQNDDKDSSELPINLYQVHTVDNTSILLGLNHQWELETYETERIAVERVVREQPQHHRQTTESGKHKDSTTGEAASVSIHSPYVTHAQSVQHSLQSMKDRIQLLVAFLEETQRGTVPPNYALLRDVQGLVYTLGPLAATTRQAPELEDALLLSHLAALAKTVAAVAAYTDKFRLVHENRPMAKETRRAF